MLLNVTQHTGKPSAVTKNYPEQNLSSVKVEKHRGYDRYLKINFIEVKLHRIQF